MKTNNNLSDNVSEYVLKKFIPHFESNRVLTKLVDTKLMQGKINADTGDSVSFKRPHRYTVVKTDDLDISAHPKNRLNSGTALGKVDKAITVPIQYSQIEEALELNQLDEILKPAAKELADALENRLCEVMVANAALSLGNVGTELKTWPDVAQTGTFLKDLGCGGGAQENYAIIDPWNAERLAAIQTQLHGSDPLIAKAWESAQIKQSFAGVSALSTNSLISRTTGAFGGALTVKTNPDVSYSALKNSYQFTVTLTGATASVIGFFKKGDQLSFEKTLWTNQSNRNALYNGQKGISFTATVLEDVDSSASGDVTVKLSGAPIFDMDKGDNNQQYNTVNRRIVAGDIVKPLGEPGKIIKPNLFFNKGFIGMGTVSLKKLESIDSSVATYDGITIRAHKYSDGDKAVNFIRLDILPTFCVFNPHLAGQFYGKVA